MVVLGKGDSAKAFSHYFALFSHYVKLVIYNFIGHKLTSIYVLYAWMILTLLMLHVIACYDRSNMLNYHGSVSQNCTTKRSARVPKWDLRAPMAMF